MKIDKKKLSESIIRNVAKSLNGVLNEGFSFDDTVKTDEVFNSLLLTIKKDKQIQKIIIDPEKHTCAEFKDWAQLFGALKKIINSKEKIENPMKISNVYQLAVAFIARGFSDKAQKIFIELDNEDLKYVANCLVKETKKMAGVDEPKQDGAVDDKQGLNDNAQVKEGEGCDKGDKDCMKEGKDCMKEGKGCSESSKENKSVTEARGFRAKGRFSQFLNESRRARK